MHLVAREGGEHEKISAKSFGRYAAQFQHIFHHIFHRIFQFHYIHYITSTRKIIEIQITSTSQQPRAGAANLVNIQGIVDEIDHVLVVVGVGRGVGRTAEWGRGQCDAISRGLLGVYFLYEPLVRGQQIVGVCFLVVVVA